MDQGLKQRIIGASVLVAAAVIFLPMLLSGQDETVQVEVQVPPEPALDDRKIVTATPPQVPQPAPVAEIPPSTDSSTEVTPDLEAPDEITSTPPEVPSDPALEPAKPPATTEGGWVIQQASFSSAENAENFRSTLVEQGYNAYTRAVESSGKTIVRVYVGPLASREAAGKVRDELSRRHKDKGQIVAHDASTRSL